jgi:hypothetical protein
MHSAPWLLPASDVGRPAARLRPDTDKVPCPGTPTCADPYIRGTPTYSSAAFCPSALAPGRRRPSDDGRPPRIAQEPLHARNPYILEFGLIFEFPR